MPEKSGVRRVIEQSPDGDQANQRKGDGHKSKIEPSPIAMGIPRSFEHLKYQPDANDESQQQANDIERRVIDGPDRLVLRKTDDKRYQNQRADKDGPQENGGNLQQGRDFFGR